MNFSKTTPMIEQYLSIKERYKDAILFYQAGDFFEMFFEDALTASKTLDIALTSRNKNDKKPIPMCGVPVRAVNGYLSKMIAGGYKVAVCEQIQEPGDAEGIIKREVVRVVTPGMIVEDDFLEAASNNYLAALFMHNKVFGVASIDISTGNFRAAESDDFKAVKEEIFRIAPSELLFPSFFKNNSNFQDLSNFFKEKTITFLDDEAFEIERGKESLTKQFKTLSLAGFGAQDFTAAIGAAGAVLYYLRETQKRDIENLSKIETYSLKNFMLIDDVSCRNLELVQSIGSGNKKGSLLSVIDKTKTPMGGRKLKKWIMYPLLDKDEINKRLNAVEEGKENIEARNAVRSGLKNIYDLERIASKIAVGRPSPKDLTSLKESIFNIPNILEKLKSFGSEFFKYNENISNLYNLADLIDKAIAEDAPYFLNEPGIIKKGYDKDLDELIEIGSDAKKWLAKLESEERKKTGINSLKVNFNKIFGYYIEISKTHADKAPGGYIRRQTLVNAERYITQELQEFETRVLNSKDKRIRLEYEIFIKIKNKIIENIKDIYNLADFIASLDVILSFSEVAETYDYAKPEIKDDDKIIIEEGRHPVVETSLYGERFVPNSIIMDNTENQIFIITGPNMAGKSTVLRQTALIILMAHIGSFVPAKRASISITDRIFTRIGALDNLSAGQSTFMVEMEETANILNNATPNSLIILDEIGRGTSTFDGFSIAKAVAEYLHDYLNKGIKTLFATHYHELMELEKTKKRVKVFSIAVKESGDNIIFLRKLVRGGTNKSYGVQVARLAGVPEKVIKRAKRILEDVEKKGEKTLYKNFEFASQLRLDLSNEISDKDYKETIIEKIRNIDTASITPLYALNFLEEIKKDIKD